MGKHCAKMAYENNSWAGIDDHFEYGGSQLTLAAAAASKLSGQSWETMWENMLTKCEIAPEDFTVGPAGAPAGLQRPGFGSGGYTSTNIYLKWLLCLSSGKMLSPEMTAYSVADHTNGLMAGGTSSHVNLNMYLKDRYAQGHWHVCDGHPTMDNSECVSAHISHSIGTLGFMPVWNRNYHYVAILAPQG